MSSRLPLAPIVSFFLVAASSLHADNRPVILDVDARETPRKIFHAKLTFPVVRAASTLAYPKRIPGEQGTTGPIADPVGLKFLADKNPIPWKRDPADMSLFSVEIPPGAQSVEAALEFFRTFRLDYAGPESYPHLERDTTSPDLLSQIIRPLAPRATLTKREKPAR